MLERSILMGAVLALVCSPALAGVAIFQGAPGEVGRVLVCSENGGALQPVPELCDVRLLGLDFVGRTGLFEFAPDRPRYRDDVPGASRLQLPAGRGSLYAFARYRDSGPISYGFFRVDAAGDARIALERGALAGGANPFLARVAVAPDGGAFLAATTLAAGGDLYEVELDTGVAVSRTAHVAPQRFGNTGLALCAAWGCAITDHGILRFARGVAGDASFAAFTNGDAPTWFDRSVVTSANGRWAATVAGASVAAEYVYVFGPDGPAVRACDTPDRIAGPGFQPEYPDGPWLAVSDDGALAAWRSELSSWGYGAELFVAELAPGAPQAPTHVTADAEFGPYIDEIGEVMFGPGRRLIFAGGNPTLSTGSGLRQADVYQVEFTSGGLQALNLTATSGQTQPPFSLYGTLAPERLLWSPQAGALLLYTHDGQQGELLRVPLGAAGSTTIIDELASFDVFGATGSDVVTAFARSHEPLERRVAGLPIALAGCSSELAEFEHSTALRGSVVRADGTVAVINEFAGDQFVWRLRDDQDPERMTARELLYGPCVAFAPSGAIVTTVGAPGAPSLFVIWPEAESARRLFAGALVGCLLPGP